MVEPREGLWVWLARVTLETRDPYVKLKGMRAATYTRQWWDRVNTYTRKRKAVQPKPASDC